MSIRLRFSTELWAPDSAAIRWRTQCAHSHVEFERDDGSTLGARLIGGFIQRPPSANRHQSRVVHATYLGIELAHSWAMTQLLGMPYNWKGILGIALARDYEQNGHTDCSQAMFLCAYYGARLPLISSTVIAPWKMTPRDLLLSTELTFE